MAHQPKIEIPIALWAFSGTLEVIDTAHEGGIYVTDTERDGNDTALVRKQDVDVIIATLEKLHMEALKTAVEEGRKAGIAACVSELQDSFTFANSHIEALKRLK